ncbi:MAG: hypothetical protein Q8L98_05620 [Chlamydiales bacterium]|nr:hypothetical protein [Chlamydiales bacterium]
MNKTNVNPNPSLFKELVGAEAVNSARKARKIDDHEGLRDHSILALQKPASIINMLGTLTVKVIEVGSFFKWFGDKHFIVPLSSAVSGLGIALCISEIALETLALKRVTAFQAQFINSPAPNVDHEKEIRQWAKKTQNIAEHLDKKTPTHGFDEIAKSCKNLLLAIDHEDSWLELAQTLEGQVLSKDLNTLNNLIGSLDEKGKERLYRRLGMNFVDQALGNLASLTNLLNNKIDESNKPTGDQGLEMDAENITSTLTNPENKTILDKAKEELRIMNIQIQKRQLIHTIGLIGNFILGMGLVLSFVNPLIALPFIFLGVLISFIRFILWTGFAESKEWKCELGTWAKNTVSEIKETLWSLLKMSSEAVGERQLLIELR